MYDVKNIKLEFLMLQMWQCSINCKRYCILTSDQQIETLISHGTITPCIGICILPIHLEIQFNEPEPCILNFVQENYGIAEKAQETSSDTGVHSNVHMCHYYTT